MKEVHLTQGKVALVDDEDFDRVAAFRWQAFLIGSKGSPEQQKWYACRRVRLADGRRSNQLMHRFILDDCSAPHIDHANGNGLDNRRANLRPCTAKENNRNRVVQRASSRYKGVHWHCQGQKWCAQIRVDGKKKHLGLFASETQAATAYDDAAIYHFGDYARLNLPKRHSDRHKPTVAVCASARKTRKTAR